jgi:hypothetical protein
MKFFFFLYFYSTLLYIIFTVSMVLQSRKNMKKSMYLGPFQNKFLFLFCPPLKYFCLPILLPVLIEQILKLWENKILFSSHPPLKIFQNFSALNKA